MSSRRDLPPLVETPEQLDEVAQKLRSSSEPVSIDTERAGGYRYGNHTYLVQVRKDDIGTYVIDTGELRDLSSLQGALAGTWILHAADQDLLGLEELQLHASSIFDTEIAARLAGYTKFSLGALVESILGEHLEKSHQNEDWSTRPLPADWLRYAALDVQFLGQLRAKLTEELVGLGRLEFAEQEFAHMLANPLVPRVQTWRDTKGLGKVRDRRGLEVARQLWLARDRVGQEVDTAPGRILPNSAIVEAAQRVPTSRTELRSIPGIRKPSARRYFATWDAAVAKARATPQRRLPDRRPPQDLHEPPPARAWKRSDPDAWSRLQVMREVVGFAADTLSVEADVVLQPAVQRAAVWPPFHNRSTSGLLEEVDLRMEKAGARPWQRSIMIETFTLQPEALKGLKTPS